MTVKFSDLVGAFDYVNSGMMGEQLAYLDKDSGKIYWHSEVGDNFEELPEDIDDEKYIEIPHRHELDLGKMLVFDFVDDYLPDERRRIESIFSKKGAYSKFKAFLDSRDLLDKWHEYEDAAEQKALSEWCEMSDIKVDIP